MQTMTPVHSSQNRAAPSNSPLELGLFLPDAVQPLERLRLHPDDVAYMAEAAQLQNLRLADFIVLGAYLQAKAVVSTSHPKAPEAP